MKNLMEEAFGNCAYQLVCMRSAVARLAVTAQTTHAGTRESKISKMKTSCSTECCPTEAATQQSDCPTKCATEAESGCPIDGAAEMWKGSFLQAMRQAQVDILKAKIQKAWGPVMDQAADALLESMGAFWQSKIAEVRAAEACQDFKGKLRDLWLEEKKK